MLASFLLCVFIAFLVQNTCLLSLARLLTWNQTGNPANSHHWHQLLKIPYLVNLWEEDTVSRLSLPLAKGDYKCKAFDIDSKKSFPNLMGITLTN